MCVYIYMHTCMHTRVLYLPLDSKVEMCVLCVHEYMYACVCAYIYIYIHIHRHTSYIHTHKHTCMHTKVLYLPVPPEPTPGLNVCVHMYMYIYIYIYIMYAHKSVVFTGASRADSRVETKAKLPSWEFGAELLEL
jgi:hypothetical protein